MEEWIKCSKNRDKWAKILVLCTLHSRNNCFKLNGSIDDYPEYKYIYILYDLMISIWILLKNKEKNP